MPISDPAPDFYAALETAIEQGSIKAFRDNFSLACSSEQKRGLISKCFQQPPSQNRRDMLDCLITKEEDFSSLELGPEIADRLIELADPNRFEHVDCTSELLILKTLFSRGFRLSFAALDKVLSRLFPLELTDRAQSVVSCFIGFVETGRVGNVSHSSLATKLVGLWFTNSSLADNLRFRLEVIGKLIGAKKSLDDADALFLLEFATQYPSSEKCKGLFSLLLDKSPSVFAAVPGEAILPHLVGLSLSSIDEVSATREALDMTLRYLNQGPILGEEKLAELLAQISNSERSFEASEKLADRKELAASLREALKRRFQSTYPDLFAI